MQYQKIYQLDQECTNFVFAVYFYELRPVVIFIFLRLFSTKYLHTLE